MQVVVPSERKFEIFHAVETQKLSRREAAKRFGISPTRVQQITADVLDFIGDYGSLELLNVSPERLELFSLRQCYARIDFFYTDIIRQKTALEGQPNSAVTCLRLTMAAAKLWIEKTKLAGRIGQVQQAMIEAGTDDFAQHTFVTEEEDDDDDEAYEADAHDERDEEEAREDEAAEDQPTSPPVGGCTGNASKLTFEQQSAILDVMASLGPNPSWEEFGAKLIEQGLHEVIEKASVQLPPEAERILAFLQEAEEEDAVSVMSKPHPK